MWLKEARVIFLSHMVVDILCNGRKNVTNCIMGARVFIVVGIIKKVDSVTSMVCVHMHQRILAIEGCGNLSCIWSIVQKDGEDN